MTQLSFYIVSDVHGYIFPTDFSKTNQQLPMGLLYANLLIEQSSKTTIFISKSTTAISYKGTFMQLFSIRVTL